MRGVKQLLKPSRRMILTALRRGVVIGAAGLFAVPGVVGGLAYAAARATIAFTNVLDPLFPVAGLIGVWAVAAGTWLLARTRRSAAMEMS